MTTPRTKVLRRIADQLAASTLGHPVRVAVDGITASGKSTFADELADAVSAAGRTPIRVTMDGFHHRRQHRHRQGSLSSDGYYEDAYDFAATVRDLLTPLGPGGDRRYRDRVIDLARDLPIEDGWAQAASDAVLIVDGSFLQRPEIRLGWDEVVYLDVDFEIAVERGVRRDAVRLGGVEAARRAFEQRYHTACRRYLREIAPTARPSIVVDNNDVSQPTLRLIGGHADTAPLFSYGTLQQATVQLARFGRRLTSQPDRLPGYRLGWTEIADADVVDLSGSARHPIARTGDPSDQLDGLVLDLTPRDLASADDYETIDYQRTWCRLDSGREAWVYVARADV